MFNSWGPLFPYPLPSSHIWDAFSHHLGFSHQKLVLGCGFSGKKQGPDVLVLLGFLGRSPVSCVQKGEKVERALWSRGLGEWDLVVRLSHVGRELCWRGRWSICQNQATNSHRGWFVLPEGIRANWEGAVSPSILIPPGTLTQPGAPLVTTLSPKNLSCQLISKTLST